MATIIVVDPTAVIVVFDSTPVCPAEIVFVSVSVVVRIIDNALDVPDIDVLVCCVVLLIGKEFDIGGRNGRHVRGMQLAMQLARAVEQSYWNCVNSRDEYLNWLGLTRQFASSPDCTLLIGIDETEPNNTWKGMRYLPIGYGRTQRGERASQLIVEQEPASIELDQTNWTIHHAQRIQPHQLTNACRNCARQLILGE